VLFFSVFAGLASSSAEKRVALVIGNAKYEHIAGLPNVPNDAKAMEALFKAAKFDAVEMKENLRVAELRKALREFSALAAGAGMAVVYFAGHGIEVDRTNYLIPVDAKLAADIDVEDETVSLDRVLQLMEPAKRLRLVILDACRESPFARSMKRTVATRTIGRGLGRIEPATSNTLIAFATKANAVAEDGKGANSPFTAALMKHLATPGLDVILALRRVRDEVMASTGNKQEPYFAGTLGGKEITLVPAAVKTTTSLLVLPPAPPDVGASKPAVDVPPQPQPSEAERAWSAAKDTTSIAVLEAFRRQYGATNAFYDRLAQERIDELRRQQVALLKAEEDRKRATAEAEAKKQAALLKAEQDRKRAEAASLRPKGIPTPFRLSQRHRLKVQDSLGSSDPGTGGALTEVARSLKELSGGTLELDILPPGAVAHPFQLLDAVHAGQLDGGWHWPIYYYGKTKAAVVYAGHVPSGLDASSFVRWIEAEGAAQMNRILSTVLKLNARSVPCAILGPTGDWLKRPVPDDFKGFKFRAVGLAADVGQGMGATIIQLPGGEVIPAMERGIIDGTDWTTPLAGVTVMNLPSVAKYLYYPGWTRPVQLIELLVSSAKWQQLGGTAQQAIEAVCRQSMHKYLNRIPEFERWALEEARKKGVTVKAYGPRLWRSVKESSDAVLAQLAQQDPNAAAMLDSYNGYRR
jgi:TRAP-type mannitol/chloroaromatic compound transport system substrate-binding protein